MRGAAKTQQLQIRVSAAEKAAIRQAATRAGLDLSAYALARLHSPPRQQFQRALAAVVADSGESNRFALAELNRTLSAFLPSELRDALAGGIAATMPPMLANYVAAMIETACSRRAIAPPAWTRAIAPLQVPLFGSPLLSLRLYLLTHSPAPFRRRNIFIDASVGAQV